MEAWKILNFHPTFKKNFVRKNLYVKTLETLFFRLNPNF